MNNKESKTIETLLSEVRFLSGEIAKFKINVNERLSKAEEQVEKKHLPINLEQSILSSVQNSIAEAIKNNLVGYGSPLASLVTQVVNARNNDIRKVITEAFDQVISTSEFKASIVNAFSHKVARSIISNNDGLFDKVSNELKQSAEFKAKMTLAVANVVEECLRK